MTFAVSRQQHALLSYAILLGVLAVVTLPIVQPLLAERAAFFARLDGLRLQYARTLAEIAASDVIRAEAEARQLEYGIGEELFSAETAALAAAELQQALRTLIEREDSSLLTSTFRTRSESLPVVPVTVGVRLRCSIDALVEILYALENHRPLLFVEHLSIQSAHRPGRSPSSLAEELDVDLEVTGYLNERVPQR